MVIALDPNEKRPYVVIDDQKLPKEQQTVFWIKPMDYSLRAEIDDLMGIYVGKRENVGAAMAKILERCLVGWDNLKSSSGALIPFAASPNGGASPSSLSLLKQEWRIELGAAIYAWSALSEADAKN